MRVCVCNKNNIKNKSRGQKTLQRLTRTSYSSCFLRATSWRYLISAIKRHAAQHSPPNVLGTCRSHPPSHLPHSTKK